MRSTVLMKTSAAMQRCVCRLEPSGILPKAVFALDQAILADLNLADDDSEDSASPESSSQDPHPSAAASAASPDPEQQARTQRSRARLKAQDVPQEFVALANRCGFVAPSETQYVQAGESL